MMSTVLSLVFVIVRSRSDRDDDIGHTHLSFLCPYISRVVFVIVCSTTVVLDFVCLYRVSMFICVGVNPSFLIKII